jgi:hypothetical protein
MARAYDDAEPPQDDGLARAALCRRSRPASDIGHHVYSALEAQTADRPPIRELRDEVHRMACLHRLERGR